MSTGVQDAKAAWDGHVDTRTGIAPPKPMEPSELAKLRDSVGSKFSSFAKLMGAASAALPQTGDGSKLTPDEDPSLLEKAEGVLRDMSHLRLENIQTLIEAQKQKISGEPTDDKTYFMEGLIKTAAALPDGSKMRDAVTHKFLEQLWNDLEHPPQSYLGTKYQYRAADGSNNSLIHPQLGAAGTPYARTVKPVQMQTPARPDPGVVFDSIMTRKHAELHPNRISSMLFYLASIIIHDCFRTSHEDFSVSMTSSYLDLSPLYGSNQYEQDQMRTKVDGKIKPDCFSEVRLLFFPPGVGAMLIMFNRFHNYVVENLALINEQNRFPKPAAEAPKATGDEKKDKMAKEKHEASKVKYDNDLFQTGRLITCGLYVNIILIDYVRTILDLNRTDSNWQLNPRLDMDNVPIGVGNQVSAEFNLVYRWHSTVSDRDEKWTQEMWDGMFGEGRDPKTVGKYEFLAVLNKVYEKTDKDPSKREFAGLERAENGTLPDQALVDILVSSIEDCANSFGPNRVPSIFRAIEILGIEQARSWHLGSLNEFRKYFDLEPHKSFEDITSDKYVQEQLKHLYDHPDKVEIYPGIVVEDAKQPMAPGSGLCPGYTTSRAVLSDAVALVRGDRFYTKDYNASTLTNWGYTIADSDLDIDNGCVFYKLFLRAFPNHFKQNSVYAHYPLTIPSAMQEALKDLKKDKLYDFSKPKLAHTVHVVKEYKLATDILKDQEVFKVVTGTAIEYLMGPSSRDFMLSGDTLTNASSRTMIFKALYTPDWEEDVRSFYAAKTKDLLRQKSAHIADFNQVDIIRDVGNLAHVHFCAEMFMLPLKTVERPHGIFTEAELYLILSSIFALIFFDVDPAGSFPLHIKARKATQLLGSIVEKNVDAISKFGWLHAVTKAIWPEDTALKGYGIHMIQRLLDSGMPVDKLVWGHLFSTAGSMVSNQGQLFAQTLEFYLLGAGKQYWPEIQKLANDQGDASWDKLMHYVMEGGRLNGETAVTRHVARATSLDSNTPYNQADEIFINLRAASHDANVFPDPLTVRLDRPLDAYIHLGHGPHECLGAPMVRVILTTMIREVARLKNLRPAPGPQGKIHKVEKGGGKDEFPFHAYLTEMQDRYFAFPCALKVVWDV
ncbi:heme peroxidase [Ampelomyces quisqualis]|uniref:Heme peroxidase n=1 Tax=Ampelomyces quisqualis TaxID=50730 RepID=A0A6A5QN09_AMPQU|nr:heme peroxidase [Ampelomyces quisqualis]